MFKKVLVPIDLNEPAFAEEALKLALREVEDNGAELHLLTVVPGFTNSFVAAYFSEKDHINAVKKIAGKLQDYSHTVMPEGVHPILRVYEGSPAETIVDYITAKEINLVIMPAHHRSKIDEFFLGSVSARVAERAKCSVLLLKDNN
ncbi:universal stress protein [Neptunomonas qingdaonensis]|uniref:Nucleotide-binding universal stress protein, UspA family n=1 Tax=Neptunomonas qingdaonensis TaxID=1045558 RepID=A0A1I2QTF0_9GAMM|nr:universal stress protein [Neptunomonas qingdaonensis]SFG29547.1 Nucleotide-binding universal stress protein, UspA family [Neptunomonas qingdaonensis]